MEKGASATGETFAEDKEGDKKGGVVEHRRCRNEAS